MFICDLHCQLFYVFPVICYIKTRPDAKFSIVPEEGWFGQPKYSTRSKKHSTLCRFLPLYSPNLGHPSLKDKTLWQSEFL